MLISNMQFVHPAWLLSTALYYLKQVFYYYYFLPQNSSFVKKVRLSTLCELNGKCRGQHMLTAARESFCYLLSSTCETTTNCILAFSVILIQQQSKRVSNLNLAAEVCNPSPSQYKHIMRKSSWVRKYRNQIYEAKTLITMRQLVNKEVVLDH